MYFHKYNVRQYTTSVYERKQRQTHIHLTNTHELPDTHTSRQRALLKKLFPGQRHTRWQTLKHQTTTHTPEDTHTSDKDTRRQTLTRQTKDRSQETFSRDATVGSDEKLPTAPDDD